MTTADMRAEAKKIADQWTMSAKGSVRLLGEIVTLVESYARGTESELKRYKEREQHFASALAVADGGQYRNDWDVAIERMFRERNKARTERTRLLKAVWQAKETYSLDRDPKSYRELCDTIAALNAHDGKEQG